MKQAIEKGTPVNPPIWWIDPLDPEAHKINDEYLLGENILVAPVTIEAAESRNIYLPKGKWYDVNRVKTHEGPIWLTDYLAPLNVLPYFLRVK
ncbi:SITS-binding protein-like [Temnothorax curvispinosus]|uniref:SITS-binding protein-like n=1 Tax=Temnothorax curvispinosus TaxID=300111 RepID=A0A6J1QJL6_9HYME|nr:SITS-binding protein-like [Temnothorax curvispinosus]